MQVWHMSGAGNDFMVLDARGKTLDYPTLAKKLCAMTKADGFMAVDTSEKADFRMHFYNSDGSRGEMCGNGSRCICRFAYENGIAGEQVRVETDAGIVKGERRSKDTYRVWLNVPGVLDLYCGAGTITLIMARAAGAVLGVEVVPQAVEDARENARRNGIENAEFFCGDAGEAAAMLAKKGEKIDVVVVDPPRKGLSPEAVAAVAAFAPRKLVYVSCDPATLARDIARLKELGFHLKSAQTVDLFPRCAHIESVVLFTR